MSGSFVPISLTFTNLQLTGMSSSSFLFHLKTFPHSHVNEPTGSDRWTAEEKRYFNKGISAYRKDFFMVQKLVHSLTVLLQRQHVIRLYRKHSISINYSGCICAYIYIYYICMYVYMHVNVFFKVCNAV